MKVPLISFLVAILLVGGATIISISFDDDYTSKNLTKKDAQKEAVQEKANDDPSIPKKNKLVKLMLRSKKYVDWSNLKDRNGITYLAEGSRFADLRAFPPHSYLPNTDKPFSGYAKRFYENGQEEISVRFEDGYPNWVEQWQEDGTPKWKLRFMAGKVVGSDLPFEDWSDIKSSTFYSVVYYENGQEKLERTYKDGKPNGRFTWWNEKGKKIREENYKDGKREGLRTLWYENGQVKSKEFFKDGKRDGRLAMQWYENGQEKWKENYRDRKLMSAVVWKPNGEKCSETNLKDGNGVVVNYFIDGKKERKRNYKDGKLDGLRTLWYSNGQKWTETNYKNGKKDGLETHWGWFGRESQTNYKDGIKVED